MTGSVVVLTGGVGGAKLVLGLTQIVAPADITAIVNTGDDFQHLGLSISPDIDTLLYTLSGKSSIAKGWGREDESWNFMAALQSLGGEDWFQLGDGDLALHILRTARLTAGANLSQVTAAFAQAWGLGIRMLPMSDDPVSTQVFTDEGELPFQRYFVERRCEPRVQRIEFRGVATARPAPGVCEAIVSDNTRAIVIAPSNPYLSIDPILAIPGIAEALRNARAPVIAVSPIVGGQAVKGPTAKLMQELGAPVSPAAVAAHYGALLDGMVVDQRDGPQNLAIAQSSTDTLMLSLEDRVRVAREALTLADRLSS